MHDEDEEYLLDATRPLVVDVPVPRERGRTQKYGETEQDFELRIRTAECVSAVSALQRRFDRAENRRLVILDDILDLTGP